MSKVFYNDLKVGILGGGQLGKMLIQSGINFNINFQVLDSDKDAPSKTIANEFKEGKITNFDTVVDFGRTVDILTIEIENVNVDALKQLEDEGVKVFPQSKVIRLIQDKRLQKKFYQDHQIPTEDFVLINSKTEINQYQDWFPAVYKMGKAGYDGRGVCMINSLSDIEKAFDVPGILERCAKISKEIAVLIARNENGEISLFPTVEMVFNPAFNLVDHLISPASISEEINTQAQTIAKDIITKLEMVGLLAVELFLTTDNRILVNEIAPRPHNSGHHTIEANVTSQYEQHLRAILNLPLGKTNCREVSAMVNLIGEDGYNGIAKYEGIEKIMTMDKVFTHLYGKKFTKPSRKMGHITVLGNDKNEVLSKIKIIKENIKVIA